MSSFFKKNCPPDLSKDLNNKYHGNMGEELFHYVNGNPLNVPVAKNHEEIISYNDAIKKVSNKIEFKLLNSITKNLLRAKRTFSNFKSCFFAIYKKSLYRV